MASASCSGGITGGSYGLRRARWASTSGATRRTSSIVVVAATVEPGERGRGAAQRQVGAQPLGADGEGQPARRVEDVVADGRGRSRSRAWRPAPRRRRRTPDRRRRQVVGEAATHGFGPLGDVGRGA